MIRAAHAMFAAVLVGLPTLCPAAAAFDALTLIQSPEDAEVSPTAEKGPEVRVSVAALAWLTGIDGSLTIDGDSYDADLSLMLGYKAIYIDYDEGGGPDEFKWDATISGPFVGLKIAF